MDLAGNIIWERIYEMHGNDFHQFKAKLTPNDDIIIVGSSVNYMMNKPLSYASINKIDSNGNLLWSKPFDQWMKMI